MIYHTSAYGCATHERARGGVGSRQSHSILLMVIITMITINRIAIITIHIIAIITISIIAIITINIIASINTIYRIAILHRVALKRTDEKRQTANVINRQQQQRSLCGVWGFTAGPQGFEGLMLEAFGAFRFLCEMGL